MATAAGISAERASGRGRPRGRARLRRALTGYAFIGPNLAVFALFMFVPLVLTFVKALQESSGFGPSTFVGLDNFRRLGSDPAFWRSFADTLGYAVITVPLLLGGGLGIALLINRRLPARGLFRAIFFLPAVISTLSAGVVAWWMFDENVGVINKLVTSLGLGAIPWASSPFWAATSVVLVTLWTGIGFNMVVYLAGLQSIPREYYDACAVDGGTPWQQFVHVTVPGLRTATFFLTVYGIIGSFQAFDIIYVLTRGGPGNSTSVLGTYAYETAFTTRERGYGAAIGVVLYLLLMVVTLVQWRIGKRRGD